MSARKRVVVHGDVQGVFFRDATREEARSHGVAGWVCNRADGKVEAVFEGDPGAVNDMVEFARRGSPQAVVDHVDVSDEEPEGAEGFSAS
jgi:acylphosphatase